MSETTKKASRILIVDDNPKIGTVMVQQLHKDGYETRTAANGFDVGWIVREFQPDLIFLDIMMPGMNGIEVCRQIRADEHTRGIKIIGMSATEDETMITQMRQAGVDDFMRKPFALHDLKDRVVKQIGDIHLDPAQFTNNRILAVIKDPAWARAWVTAMKLSGYHVSSVSSPEEAGFRIRQFHPHAIVIEALGTEDWLRTMTGRIREHPDTKQTLLIGVCDEAAPAVRRAFEQTGVNTVFPKTAPHEEWIRAIESRVGKIQKRRESMLIRRRTLSMAVAALSLLAIVLALVISFSEHDAPSVGGRAIDDDPIAAWAKHEQSARINKLVFHERNWVQRYFLGKAVKITLSNGQTHEGFMKEIDRRIFVHTLNGPVWLEPGQIKTTEPVRLAYEDYWDKTEKLADSDAAGHFTLAQWCSAQNLKEPAWREMMKTLIAAPNHAEARRALGYVRQGDRWVKSQTSSPTR